MERPETEVVLESPLIRQQLYAEEMFGGAAVVVIGEPTSEEHKNAILERIAQGFMSWDNEATGCDIGAELAAVAAEAPSGVSGAHGEQVVRHGSDTFQLEVMVNPRRETLIEGLRLLLLPPTKHKHLIYAGYSFTGTGDWVLQDGTWSFSDLLSTFKQTDVDLSLQEQKDSTFSIHCGTPCGQWAEDKLKKTSVGKNLIVSVNPSKKVSEEESIIEFTKYLSYLINVIPTNQLLEASDVVGNIRFTNPTLYIFPAAQGDCAVFGVQGFNMLLDGGFNRRTCFWEFTRHLDRLDVLLISRISQDNLFGMKSFLQRRLLNDIHPEITYAFFNSAPTSDKDCTSSLSISLTEEASMVSSFLKSLGCKPGSVYASPSPVPLYSKIGHGTLDMFVLNPNKDAHDYKEMLKQWNNSDSFTQTKAGIPLNELCSLATMLVWKSHSGDVTRILYPGSTPQHELIKSLEHLKDLEIFKYPNGSKNAPKLRKKTPMFSKMPEPGPPSSAPSEPPCDTDDLVKAEVPKGTPAELEVNECLSRLDLGRDKESGANDAQTETNLQVLNETPSATATSPSDAWIDTNEPVSLPDPLQIACMPNGEITVNEIAQEPPCHELLGHSEPADTIVATDANHVETTPTSLIGDTVDEPVMTLDIEPPTEFQPVNLIDDSVTPTPNDCMMHETSPEQSEAVHVDTNIPPEDIDSPPEDEGIVDEYELGTDSAQISADSSAVELPPHDNADLTEMPADSNVCDEKGAVDNAQDLENYHRQIESDVQGSHVTHVDSFEDMAAQPQEAIYQPDDHVDTKESQDDCRDQSPEPEVAVETSQETHEEPEVEDAQVDVETVEPEPSVTDDSRVAVEPVPDAHEESNQIGDLDPTADVSKEPVELKESAELVDEQSSADICDAAVHDEQKQPETVEKIEELEPEDAGLVPSSGVEVVTDSGAAKESNEDETEETCEEQTENNLNKDVGDDEVVYEAQPSCDDNTLVPDRSSQQGDTPDLAESDQQPEDTADVENTGDAALEETTDDSIAPAVESSGEHTSASEEAPVSEDTAPLMTSSQEEMYRTQASNEQGLPNSPDAEKDGDETSVQEPSTLVDTRDQLEFSDSIEGVDSSAGQSRADSLEPVGLPANQQRAEFHDHVTEGDNTRDDVVQTPGSDVMTRSFIDESTQGASDPMTDSFIDLNTGGTLSDPMTQSFIDESTMGNDLISTGGSSEVDKCSNQSMLGSTPALSDVASVSDCSDKGAHSAQAAAPSADTLDGSNTSSNASELNPFAPEFKPIFVGSTKCDAQSGNMEPSTAPPAAPPVSPPAALLDCDEKPLPETESSASNQGSASTSSNLAEFDPLKEWGEPQHLPYPTSPAPGDGSQANGHTSESKATKQASGDKTSLKSKAATTKPKSAVSSRSPAVGGPKTTAASKIASTKKTTTVPASKVPSTASKKPASAAAGDKSKTEKTTTKSSRLSSATPAGSTTTKTSRLSTATGSKSTVPSRTTTAKDKTDSKKPKSEAAKVDGKASATHDTSKLKPKADVTKAKPAEKKSSSADKPKTDVKKTKTSDDVRKTRPASGKPKSAIGKPSSTTTSSTTPSKGSCVYVDLAYVPHHGDSKYVGIEYFQFIHARYYVFSGLNPSVQAFEALLSAKSSWESDPVTIIPTYDTDVLHHWLSSNRAQLVKLNIDVAPAANRCFVQLADDNNKIPAFRLEF